MLRVPQIRQLGTSRTLLSALDNLYPRHIPTIHLEPHLHPDPAQLAPEQNRRLNPTAPDAHQHAREGLARPLGLHEQDVADAHAVAVVAGEELRARARRVHLADLVRVMRDHGRRVRPVEMRVRYRQLAHGRLRRGVDGEAGFVFRCAGELALFVEDADCREGEAVRFLMLLEGRGVLEEGCDVRSRGAPVGGAGSIACGALRIALA